MARHRCVAGEDCQHRAKWLLDGRELCNCHAVELEGFGRLQYALPATITLHRTMVPHRYRANVGDQLYVVTPLDEDDHLQGWQAVPPGASSELVVYRRTLDEVREELGKRLRVHVAQRMLAAREYDRQHPAPADPFAGLA